MLFRYNSSGRIVFQVKNRKIMEFIATENSFDNSKTILPEVFLPSWKNCGIKTLCQHSVILIFKDLFAGGRFKSTDSKHIAVLISVIAEFQNNYAVCKTGSSSVSAAVPFRRHFLTVSPFSLPERGMSRLFFPRSARCLWACCLLPCCPVFATFPTPFCRLYILFPHRPLILR